MTQQRMRTTAQPAPAGFLLLGAVGLAPREAEWWQPRHRQWETLL